MSDQIFKMSSAQEDCVTTIEALPEQGLVPITISTISNKEEKLPVVHNLPQQTQTPVTGPLTQQQAVQIFLRGIEENSEKWCFEDQERTAASSLQVVEDDSDEDSDIAIPQKGKRREARGKGQKAHLEQHRKKKAMLRRRRQIRKAADEAQNAEPSYTGQSDPIGHLEYMEIEEAVENDVPTELTGFASMGLSSDAPKQDPEPYVEPSYEVPGWLTPGCFRSRSNTEDEQAVRGARKMCKWFNDNQENPSQEVSQFSPIDADYVPTAENPFAILDEELTAHCMSPPAKYTPTARPGARDNLLCHYITCPILEPHYEGPYHHEGILGDQSHTFFKGSNPPPWVWTAYQEIQDRCSLWYEEETVMGFWTWHVPPFCHIPDHDEDEDAGNDSVEHGQLEEGVAGMTRESIRELEKHVGELKLGEQRKLEDDLAGMTLGGDGKGDEADEGIEEL